MVLEKDIRFDKKTFTNESLYNSGVFFNPDDTTSLRIGKIDNLSPAGQQIIDRLIYSNYVVDERTAHIMADYNLDSGEFSAIYYPSMHGIRVPLSKSEQQSAVAAFKDKYFESEQSFEAFRQKCFDTQKEAHKNIEATKILSSDTLKNITIDVVPEEDAPLEVTCFAIRLSEGGEINVEWDNQQARTDSNQFMLSGTYFSEDVGGISYSDIREIVVGFNSEPNLKAVNVTIDGFSEWNFNGRIICEKAVFTDLDISQQR